MKKGFVTIEIDRLDWSCGASIKKIREDIDRVEKLGATYIDIETKELHDDVFIEVLALCSREETDEEFERRKKAEESYREIISKSELDQLAKLKAKYESGNGLTDKEKFVSFLKSHGAYESFMRNYSLAKHSDEDIDYGKYAISGSFDWYDINVCPEGADYWWNLDIEWRKYLKQ